MKPLRITEEQLRGCWNFWVNDKSLQSSLRFGQYVWNKYGKEPWPLLYYETDTNKSYELLYENLTTPSSTG